MKTYVRLSTAMLENKESAESFEDKTLIDGVVLATETLPGIE
ncbi:hypothetical protein [Endozoicomonas lisbonensis]|uniref:Uncharacterized protein n=1 Tax=Endozoicomonas lisbonensis TaxID=3120522 RepID=A0ABV2SE64_9GAMM